MERRTTDSPQPWRQFELRTTFLRVPDVDWADVRRGLKTEFRLSGRAITQLWNVQCPTPVVAYRLTNRRNDHQSALMVLEATWREPLGAISEESLAREGFESMAHFRRYWMQRTKRRFPPMLEVQVYHVRPFTERDRVPLALAMLDKLYQEHLPDVRAAA